VYKRVGSHVFMKWCLALVIIPCTIYMALTMAEYVAKGGYELKRNASFMQQFNLLKFL